MKVKLTKAVRVNALSGEVEVDTNEAARLLLLGAIEPVKEERKIPEKEVKKETRKK